MREDGINGLALLASHVNVVAVGSLDDSLELVTALLVFVGWVEQVLVHYRKILNFSFNI
jgi:hypothetical protein